MIGRCLLFDHPVCQ